MKRLMEKEDFKISSYYRKDYASLHVIYAFLSVSVGYVCLVALLLLAGVEDIMSNMSNGLILFFSDHSGRLCGCGGSYIAD